MALCPVTGYSVALARSHRERTQKTNVMQRCQYFGVLNKHCWYCHQFWRDWREGVTENGAVVSLRGCCPPPFAAAGLCVLQRTVQIHYLSRTMDIHHPVVLFKFSTKRISSPLPLADRRGNTVLLDETK